MTMITVASWNVNGLNGPVKCSACLDFMKRHEIQVALIQESHLTSQDCHCFANKYYYTAAAASLNSKSCGALVVLKRNLSVNVIETYGSSDGRVAYIKTMLVAISLLFLFMLPIILSSLSLIKLTSFYPIWKASQL